jgi:hypothetical protein
MKPRILRWEEHITGTEKRRNGCRIFIGKPFGNDGLK